MKIIQGPLTRENVEDHERYAEGELKSTLRAVAQRSGPEPTQRLSPAQVLAGALAKVPTPKIPEDQAQYIRDAFSSLVQLRLLWSEVTGRSTTRAAETALALANALPGRSLDAAIPADVSLSMLPKGVAQEVQNTFRGTTIPQDALQKALIFTKSPLYSGDPNRDGPFLRTILTSNRGPQALAAYLSTGDAEGIERYAHLGQVGAKALATDAAEQGRAFTFLSELSGEAAAKAARAGGQDALHQALYQGVGLHLTGSLPANNRALLSVLQGASLQGMMDLYGDPKQQGDQASFWHLKGLYTPRLRTPFTGALTMLVDTSLSLDERKQRLELGVRATELGRSLLWAAATEGRHHGDRVQDLTRTLQRLGIEGDAGAALGGSSKEQERRMLDLEEAWAGRVDRLLASTGGVGALTTLLANLMSTAQDQREFRIVFDGLYGQRLDPRITQDGLRLPFKLEKRPEDGGTGLEILPTEGGYAAQGAPGLKQLLNAAFYSFDPSQRAALAKLTD